MISKILRTMRRKANLKQQVLASRCNIAPTTLSGYENSYREPTFNIIEKIANECGYEILFKNTKNNEVLTSKNINRKEI